MGLLTDFTRRVFRNIGTGGTSTLANPSPELERALIGLPTAAGKPVTRETAQRVAAFLSAVKMLANDIAKMPLILRQTTIANGRQRTQPALDDPLYSVLKDAPNRWQTSFQLRWFLISQLIMRGNCFCQVLRDQKGDVKELIPLDAWRMSAHWDYDAPLFNVDGLPITTIDPRTKKKLPVPVWHYFDGEAHMQKFYQPDLWHVTSHNLENIGIEGAAIIVLAKEALSVLMAAEEVAGRNFANGLGMGGFISFPADAEVDETQAQGIVDRFKKDFSGSQNAGKFSIIPFGGKWEKMTFNAQESQLLESRKWNEQEVVRLLGGAPLLVKLGLGEQNSTYASSSAFLDEYFNSSLLPYTTAIEQSITRDLIALEDRGKLYAKHNADIILRGSPKERADTNKELIASGQLTLNEARAIEDRDWIEGGDVLSLPANSCVFDIEQQEWFIPGQKPPEAEGQGQAPDEQQQPEPDEQGSSDDNDATEPPQKPTAPPAKKPKAQARLEELSVSLAERVMRKAVKADLEAKFVAEVLRCSEKNAEEYVSAYKELTPDEQRQRLVQLVVGETHEQE